MKYTKLERNWVMYDVGNSALVLLNTSVVPIYFNAINTGASSADLVVAWGNAQTIASLVIAMLMPILGALADYAGNKIKFFIGFFAGLISHKGGHYGEKASLNFVGALVGNLAYTLLFYGKNFISEYFLLRLEMNTIIANMLVRLSASALQIPLTLIVTMILAPFFLKAIQKAGIHRKLFPERTEGHSAA